MERPDPRILGGDGVDQRAVPSVDRSSTSTAHFRAPDSPRRAGSASPAERFHLVPRRDDERDPWPALRGGGAIGEGALGRHRPREPSPRSSRGRTRGRWPRASASRFHQPCLQRIAVSPAGHGSRPTSGGFEGTDGRTGVRGTHGGMRDGPSQEPTVVVAGARHRAIAAVTEMVPVSRSGRAGGVAPARPSVDRQRRPRWASVLSASVLLGVAFQLLISVVAALLYLVASDRRAGLRRHPVLTGIA